MSTARDLLLGAQKSLALLGSRPDPNAAHKTLRELLVKRTPSNVIAFFFSDSLHDSRPEIVQQLRVTFLVAPSPARAALAWVYGESPLLGERVYLRLPTPSKRTLVRELLKHLKPQYAWMTSRVLHAYAFRPNSFQRSKAKNGHASEWGPLYRRVQMDHRTLHVPNQPLMFTQRKLLELVQPALVAGLSDAVFGIPRSNSATIFDNARVHLEQVHFASFDLTSFFPSVRLSDVIYGVNFLSAPMMLRDSEPHGHIDIGSTQASVPWAHDATLLACKLATRRNRLPQGAPTSPLFANVAFAPYDQKIMDALPEGIVYSRYFDDLTFSIGPNAAQKTRILSGHDLRVTIEKILVAILDRTSFSLNPGKTANSQSHGVFSVTGIQIRGSVLQMTRKMRRRVRAAEFALTRPEQFTESARKRWTREKLREGSRDEQAGVSRHFGKGRSVSTEYLSCLMLRRMQPEFQITRVLDDISRRRLGIGAVPVTGRERWEALEGIVAGVWSGDLNRQFDDESLFILSGELVRAKLPRGPVSRFLALDPDSAIATTESWHELQGLAAYLQSAPVDCAPSIVDAGSRLRDALIRATFPDVAPISLPSTQHDGAPPLFRDEKLTLTADRLTKFVDQFRTQAGDPVLTRVVAAGRRLGHEPQTKEEFSEFVANFSILIRSEASILPNGKNAAGFFEALDLLNDLAAGRRHSPYQQTSEFWKRARIEDPLVRDTWREAQKYLLERSARLYEEAVAGLTRLPQDEWREQQLENPARGTMTARLEAEILRHRQRILDSYEHLVGKSVFNGGGYRALSKSDRYMKGGIAEDTIEERWDALLETALRLHKILVEGRSKGWDRKRLTKRLDKSGKMTLRVVRVMRNNCAHLEGSTIGLRAAGWKQWLRNFMTRGRSSDAEANAAAKQNEIKEIHSFVRKLIGSNRRGSAGDHLSEFPLTNLEATHAKAELLGRVRDLLERLS